MITVTTTRTPTDTRTQEVLTPEVVPAALVRQESSGFVRAIESDALGLAISEYRRIQGVLDQALPDCMMTIQGRSFRKKSYWRAVCTAFNLTVELHQETMEVLDGVLVVLVMYKATAPNGRVAFGDGACTAKEKRSGQDSIHNVRSHAHTRAFNRAVSNLVGFGEVSAEEVDKDGKTSEETNWPEMTEVRAACGRALKLGWLAADIRRVLDAHDATFINDKGTDRIQGMPPEARASAIATLAMPPVKPKSEEPKAEAKPAEPAEPEAPPTVEPGLYSTEVQSWLADTANDLRTDVAALVAYLASKGANPATMDAKTRKTTALRLSSGGSLEGDWLAFIGAKSEPASS